MKALLLRFFMVALCLASTMGYAIEGEMNMGEISGKIIDSKTSEPVSFASVALINMNDSSQVTGVITNNEGVFNINKIPYGKYNLKVSYLGYQPTIINNIDISRKNRKVEMQPTALSENVTELNEVVVTGERLKGTDKIDRTEFTINDEIRNRSSSGLDVLKSIPAVTVDFQENVTLEGKSDIQFYVDGVLRDKNFVAQIDPKTIDKVEIITNPGVKYDSDISGVINIVLKKEKRSGVNGMVMVPISNPDKGIFNPQASIEYGNKKFRVYFSDRMHYESFHGSQMLTTKIDSTYDHYKYFSKYSSGKNSWQNNNMNYGIDLFLSEKTSLNFLGEWESGIGKTGDFISKNSIFNDTILNNYMITEQNGTNKFSNQFTSLYFKHKFAKEGSELTAELNYYVQTNNAVNNYSDTSYLPSDCITKIDTLNRYDNSENSRWTYELKSDYTCQIKNLKVDAGIRVNQNITKNNFYNGLEDRTGEIQDYLKYTESRYAGYTQLSGKFKNIGWLAGLRGEYSSINISDTATMDYYVVLPQISLNRSFEKNQSVKLSFRRQIYRPSISDLNPWETWSDSLHVRVGNPNLKPAIENQLELSYAKNIGNSYISPKVYLNYTKNGIADLTQVRSGGITEIDQANIGKNLEYGIELNASVELFKIWQTSGNIGVFNRKISSNQNLSLEKTEEMLSYRFGGSSSVKLPKDFSVFCFAYYGSPNIGYQREFSRDLLFLIGANKQFKNKAKVEVYYNPFIKNFTYSKVITQKQDYREEWEGNVDVSNLFAIEFTYNFNFGGKVNKIERDVDHEKGNSGGTF
jgi:iron complex outermembrane receptor protein